jgi:hypothetical protein
VISLIIYQMRVILLFFLIAIIPCLSKAQDFPLGQSKREIRRTFNGFPRHFIGKSLSANRDTFSLPGNMQLVYFYEKNVCYKMDSIFPYSYVPIMTKTLNDKYKQLKKDIWLDTAFAMKIELFAIKDEDKCIVKTTFANSKN